MGKDQVEKVIHKDGTKAKGPADAVAPPAEKNGTDHSQECLINDERLDDYVTNPIGLFQKWFQQAFRFNVPEPYIMLLATSSAEGYPSNRPVALSNVDQNGFYFSTNKKSRKVADLKGNPRAAACFYWGKVDRVIRVDGDVIEVEDVDGKYFHSWPRNHQIGEHSKFSVGQPVEGRRELTDEVDLLTTKFAGMDTIPVPDGVQSFCIKPSRIEFMQVHLAPPSDRIVFTRSSAGGSWSCARLAR